MKRAAMKNYGGNCVRSFDLAKGTRHDFSQQPYVYFYYRTRPAEEFTLNKLGACSVFIYDIGPSAIVEVLPSGERLFKGDALQAEGQEIKLRVTGGVVQFLIAGVLSSVVQQPLLQVFRAQKIKRVQKPWGFELWINGEHPGYAFKYIWIKQGFRTSLQYHHFKQETNVLMEGRAKCSFKIDRTVANDDVRNKDIGFFNIKAVSVLDIQPRIIHRIESLTDIILCEVSTPHLDDVIRITDDANRTSGRIALEHKWKKR